MWKETVLDQAGHCVVWIELRCSLAVTGVGCVVVSSDIVMAD